MGGSYLLVGCNLEKIWKNVFLSGYGRIGEIPGSGQTLKCHRCHIWYHGQSWLHGALSYMVSLPVKIGLDNVNKGFC